MKHVFVALTACLSVMVITRSRPVAEHEPHSGIDQCKLGFCLIRLFDGFCRNISSPCQLDDLNCALRDTPWRLWSFSKSYKNCKHVRRFNHVAICDSSCPVKNCYSTEPACGRVDNKGICIFYRNLCKLKHAACANTEISHVTMARCKKAGLYEPGDSGKC